MSTKQEWHQKKIKGGFAQEICRGHFAYLEFDVEASGIEQIAPIYTKSANKVDAKANIKNSLQKTPDFLLSNEKSAFLVEVKFKTTINNTQDFYNYSDELLFDYKSMLFKCNELSKIDDKATFIKQLKTFENGEITKRLSENFIFYVVLNKELYNSYVHIFVPINYKSKEHGYGWRNAHSEHINKILDIPNFNSGYKDVIKPMLDEIYAYKS